MHPSWLLVTCGICGIDLIAISFHTGLHCTPPASIVRKKVVFVLSPHVLSLTLQSALWFSLWKNVCAQISTWDLICALPSQWGLQLRSRLCKAQSGNRPVQIKPSLWAWCWWSCFIDELACDVHGWSWLPEVWRDCCRLGVASFELACCLTTYYTSLWLFDVGFGDVCGDVWGDAASCFVCCRGWCEVRARFVSVLSVALSSDLWFIHRFVVSLVCTIHAIHNWCSGAGPLVDLNDDLTVIFVFVVSRGANTMFICHHDALTWVWDRISCRSAGRFSSPVFGLELTLEFCVNSKLHYWLLLFFPLAAAEAVKFQPNSWLIQ